MELSWHQNVQSIAFFLKQLPRVIDFALAGSSYDLFRVGFS